MTKFGRVLASVSLLPLVFGVEAAAAAQPSQAEDAASVEGDLQAEQDPQASGETGADIVVVGNIRRSLEAAAEIKRESLQVVDSIVAEDIGKFPDPTTAAALQRVPGVQVTVGANNEITGVVIRGLGDILTTLDGREFFSTTGRTFSFQDLPAEALSRVDVVKSATANLIEGGIAGITDLQLNKPFKFRYPTIVVTARGNYATNVEKLNPQLGVLVTDRWDTGIGEIGALLNLSWSRTEYNRPYLYAPVRRSTAAAPFNLPGYASQNVAGGLNEYGYFERPQANAAIQWQATPELEIYLDGLYAAIVRSSSPHSWKLSSSVRVQRSRIQWPTTIASARASMVPASTRPLPRSPRAHSPLRSFANSTVQHTATPRRSSAHKRVTRRPITICSAGASSLSAGRDA